MIQFEPTDLSILTQVVFKETFRLYEKVIDIDKATADEKEKFWKSVEENTVELARTIYRVNKRILKK